MKAEYETGEWTVSPDIRFQDESTPHHFLAISTSPAEPVEDLHAYKFAFDLGNARKNNLMVAMNTEGVTNGSEPVGLEFQHLTAHVFVNLVYYGEHSQEVSRIDVMCPTSGVLDCAGADGKPVMTLNENFNSAPMDKIGENCYEGYVFSHEKVCEVTIKTPDGNSGVVVKLPLTTGKSTTINIFWSNDKFESYAVAQGEWDENIMTYPENEVYPEMIFTKSPGKLTRAQIDEALAESSRLSIDGFLNGADLKVLREAAGCHYQYMHIPDMTAPIRQLDLSGASFVASQEIYAADDFMGEKFMINVDNVLPDVAFAKSALESLVLPKTLKGIGNKAFFGSENLTALKMQYARDLKFILELAFCNTPLETLTIPASVNQIGYGILRNCPMKRLQLDCNDAANIDEEAFKDFEQSQCNLYLNNTWSNRITTNAEGKILFDGFLWKSVNVQ